MKVGIISINMYSKGLNFACPLHNYAFQQFLLQNDVDCTVVNYTPIYYNNFDLRHPYDYYVRLCEEYEKSGKDKTNPEEMKRRTELRDAWKELYAERERRYDKFQHFIDTRYIKTEEVYNCHLLEVKDPGFDCYICCTDVIWKKEPGFGFDRGFFLAGRAMENKWKISYAASRGVYHCATQEDEDTFFHYVSDIDAISVREEILANYLKEHIDNEVTMVVDPVLLHKKEFYDEILVEPEEKGYLFLYYVMERANDTIVQAVNYARAHNLKIVEITDRPVKGGRLQEYDDVEVIYNYDMGIEEWLGYIKNADCVFTNSFHCICFSVLFEKQIFVGTRNGDKVTHVLEMFGLSDRRINAKSDIITNPLPDIDYSTVRPILEKKRKESSEFILNAIHRMEHETRSERDYDTWKKKQKFKIFYNSGVFPNVTGNLGRNDNGKILDLPSGSKEYQCNDLHTNDGTSTFAGKVFKRKGDELQGWKLRFRVGPYWCWYLESGRLVLKSEYDSKKDGPVKIFKCGEKIPYLPVNQISRVVADARWEKNNSVYWKIKRKVIRKLKRIIKK